MNGRKENVEEAMEHHLRLFKTPPQREMDLTEERILNRLHSAPAGVAEEHEAQARSSWKWNRMVFALATAAVALLAFLVVPSFIHRVDASATVESGDGKLLQTGQRIDPVKIVSASGTGAMLMLADGSHVEMRAGAALLLERADDGVRIRLNKGSVIVTAAKQGEGHLYVQTKDMTASVVGTVFLVNAEAEGSRVAVIQGEVHVRQGANLEKLLPGEQSTTSPSLEPFPVADEITWSRDSVKHVALLRQSTPASSRATGAKEFEVASIKMSTPGVTLDNSGGSYSPGRFHAKNLSLKELIQVAYQLQSFQLSGGPSWMAADRYTVEAKAESNVDRDQINQMLQGMLVKRFNLKLHREWKEYSIYDLVVADGGPRLGEPQQAGIEDRRVSGPLRHHPEFINVSVPELASILGSLLGTSVVDKTDINGRFNFTLSYSYIPNGVRDGESNEGAINIDDDSLFTAMQKQLGLKLRSVKGKVEILVVESAERPDDN